MTEALTRWSVERHRDWVVDANECGCADTRCCPDLRYALFSTNGPNRSTAHLLVYGDRSEYLGHFEADPQVAVDWGGFTRTRRRVSPASRRA